ncbi:hypothetical protein R54839_PPFHFPJH_00186 [Fructobacillus fructosus]|uniref:BppU N-terminal domain-containing protein n=1 Tax=Fructobacillus fructosus TaxID=1631 RepID=A0ABN9YIR6_9LACO|nr:hypothetical protein R54839_PPFHFPJH_00186 [Fructobacillus fructosus]
MAKNYFELNTNLDINQTAVVPALNGRQGDNDREVGFFIKDGKFPMDLSNKTIKLFAKDAAGVVKETESINGRTGITAGRFTLLVQKEFYQAVGQVEDSFIQISDKGTGQIVSTIPVSFTVLENKMVVTQTQSQLYLDTVQKVIDDFDQRIKATGTNLETLENASKHLQTIIDNINQEFNSDMFGKTKEDNDFKGNNTFEKKIIAPNGLQGKADTAGKADEATHASNADGAKNADLASKLVPTNDQTVNNLTVNGYHHVAGDTVVNKLDVNGQLFAHGDVKGFGTITSSKKAFGQTWDYGLDVYLDRVGNMVIARIHGGLIAEHGAFTKLQWDIPVGFRPVSETNMLASVGYSKGIIKVFPDGSAWNVDQTFKTSNNNGGDGVPYGFGVWPTLDDFPN